MTQSTTTPDVAIDETAIHSLLRNVVDALNEGDVDKLLSLHTDDVILMENNMPLVQGKERIRQMFDGFEKNSLVQTIAFQTHELEINGNWSFVRGAVTVSKTEPDKELQQFTGKFICLLKKQADGRWLRTHVIVNSDGSGK